MIKSYDSLEKLGRVRLSHSFYMREFLHSEIANFYGLNNYPENTELAIEVGTKLCENLLEPLTITFGKINIRSAYRSRLVNSVGNIKGHSCGSNKRNYSRHIWDFCDAENLKGAMACISIPWLTDNVDLGMEWQLMAYWINENLPYSELEFYPKLSAFNIGWHEKPKKKVSSYVKPKGILIKNGVVNDFNLSKLDSFPKLHFGF